MTQQDQLTQFQTILGELKNDWSELKTLPQSLKTLQTETDEMKQHLTLMRRSLISRSGLQPRLFAPGGVTDACARHLAATFIAHCEKSGKLEALCSVPTQRDAITAFARDELGLSTRAALTTTDVPLPVEYSGEIRELISSFGVVRKRMMPYPIGMGTARPARMGTRPAFASVAMSAAFAELSPTVTFASLESHKIGGIVRLPREIDQQSIVAMGNFLARYGAIEFARAEDTWGFNADGSATYETVKGIVQIARDNTKTVSWLPPKSNPATPPWQTSERCAPRSTKRH